MKTLTIIILQLRKRRKTHEHIINLLHNAIYSSETEIAWTQTSARDQFTSADSIIALLTSYHTAATVHSVDCLRFIASLVTRRRHSVVRRLDDLLALLGDGALDGLELVEQFLAPRRRALLLAARRRRRRRRCRCRGFVT